MHRIKDYQERGKGVTIVHLCCLQRQDLLPEIRLLIARFVFAVQLSLFPPSFSVGLVGDFYGHKCSWKELEEWWDHFLLVYGMGTISLVGEEYQWEEREIGKPLYVENHQLQMDKEIVHVMPRHPKAPHTVVNIRLHVHPENQASMGIDFVRHDCPTKGAMVPRGKNHFILLLHCQGEAFLQGFL
jgi:hypothetical protein